MTNYKISFYLPLFGIKMLPALRITQPELRH